MDHLQKSGSDPEGSRVQGFKGSSKMLNPFLQLDSRRTKIINTSRITAAKREMSMTRAHVAIGVILAFLAVTNIQGNAAGRLVGQECPEGEFVTGFDVNGNIVCAKPTGDLPPVVEAEAVAGPCVLTHVRVKLDASSSYDPENAPLSYAWEFVRVPDGSLAAFDSPSVADPTFVPDLSGIYKLRVFVSDRIHRVGSDILRIQCSRDVVIEIVSGNNQTGEPGDDMPEPLVVRVLNACGAPIPFVEVQWSAKNASTDHGTTMTNEDGMAVNRGQFGDLGLGEIVATVNSQGAIFAFEVLLYWFQ
jgi:hypothetical protein